MNLSHIGIAVKSLKDAVPIFEKIFNIKATKLDIIEDQKVKVRKFHLENCDIELLEGTAPDSPISKFIEKKGEGIHHLSFGVNDIQSAMNKIKEKGIELINEIPQRGADDMMVAFLHPKSTNKVMMELTQNINHDKT